MKNKCKVVTNPPLYYLAYGSNMDNKRMFERVKYVPRYQVILFDNYKLNFNKYVTMNGDIGYANIQHTGNEDDKCIAKLYEVTEDDLITLDTFEGVKGNHYKRQFIDIEGYDDNTIVAYIASDTYTSPKDLSPTKMYLQYLQNGVKDIKSTDEDVVAALDFINNMKHHTYVKKNTTHNNKYKKPVTPVVNTNNTNTKPLITTNNKISIYTTFTYN